MIYSKKNTNNIYKHNATYTGQDTPLLPTRYDVKARNNPKIGKHLQYISNNDKKTHKERKHVPKINKATITRDHHQ